MSAPTFEPPGKGQWVSLRDHFPRAVTPEYAELLPTAMAEGEAIPFAEYGLPIKTLTAGLVHGHVYVTPAPLVGKPSNGIPPSSVLWLVARLLPQFRRRARAARRTLATRPWLDDAARWYASERATWADANRALQADDLDAMSAADLADHIERARAHAGAGYRRHFALHGPDLLPTGLLLARCDEWGIGAEAVLPALTGCSPASMGTGPALEALRLAMRSSGASTPDGVPWTIDDLHRAAPAELETFLDEHGWRLVTGYDLDCRALIELPALVATLAAAVAPPVADTADADRALDALRRLVPSGATHELEQLVSDARATLGLRDDNGGLTGAWPMGLLRRGMLAAGRLLVANGSLQEADHALEVTVAELTALLRGQTGPSAVQVGTRAAQRARRSALVPPLQLGPTIDVPLDVLPAPMRAMSRAQLALRDTFTAPLDERLALEGDGIGDEVYVGRACVATDPAEAMARLEPGDVLVALGTTPAFNMALSLVGAVVVEEGGLLSHAAVIARELGLPALVGVAGAMGSVSDGDIVEVDPVAGRLRVVSPASPLLSPGP